MVFIEGLLTYHILFAIALTALKPNQRKYPLLNKYRTCTHTLTPIKAITEDNEWLLANDHSHALTARTLPTCF